MIKIIKYLFILIFLIPISFGYIDPGTGGYLLSSLWSALVGFIVIAFGVVVKFFRHTLVIWTKKHWKKNKLLFILVLVLIISLIFSSIYYFFIYNSNNNYTLPDYDSSLNGVQYYNKDKVYPGYNLFEGKLIDMNGKLIKSWNYSYLSVLDKKGNYLAQKSYESLEWGKFTFDGKLIWKKDLPIHHEIYIANDNSIFTFTKKVHNYNGGLVEFGVILHFNENGTLLDNYSTYDHLNNLKQFHKPLELDKPASMLIPDKDKKNTSIWGGNYDYYHLNSFSLVPENSMQGFHKAFTPGNWIISFRHGSMIFILDKDTKKVLWSAIYDEVKDNLEGQHSVSMLENGNILMFDNGRYRGWSRILELNPVDLSVVSEYKNDDFFSYSQGFVQLLPNKNLLITQSEIGRAFELDPNKEIVWDWYYNESIQDKDDGRLIRDDIYRMTKYDKNFIDKLLFK